MWHRNTLSDRTRFVKWAKVLRNLWPYLGVDRTEGLKVMGKNDICNLNLFLICGPEGGRPPGNVRVNLPDLLFKYGPDTTSRSEVIEFTVIVFLGEKLGNLPPLSPLLVIFGNSKKRNGSS